MRYLDKSIEELHELLKSKTIKPIDLVEEAFARIEENKDLNAYITLNKEEALKQAKELEDKEVDNVLFGIPIAVKDNIITKGLRTTCASRILTQTGDIQLASTQLNHKGIAVTAAFYAELQKEKQKDKVRNLNMNDW